MRLYPAVIDGEEAKPGRRAVPRDLTARLYLYNSVIFLGSDMLW
jgi:hypothetical protein